MKLLFVCNLFHPEELGGSRYPLEVCTRLARRGHEVTIVSSRVSPVPSDHLESVRRVTYPVIRWHPVTTHVSNIWSARRCVAGLLQTEPWDVILLSSYDVAVGTLFVPEARRTPTVFIYHSRFYHPRIHAQGRERGDLVRWPFIRHSLQTYMRHLERWTFRRVERIVAVSRFSQREINAVDPGSPSRSVVIPTGVDTERFVPAADRAAAKAALGLDPARPLIIGVGRLTPVKRLDRWLHVVAHLPTTLTWQGVLLGSGPEEPALRRQAQQLGIASRVAFAGYVPGAAVHRWMQAADLSLCTSQFENQSLAMLEALACGTPVVGPPVGGIPDTLTAVDQGLVAAEDNIEALAACTQRVLEQPPPATQALRERCRQMAVSAYDWEPIVGQLEHLLEEVVDEAAAVAPTH